jgi:hypothetical protein
MIIAAAAATAKAGPFTKVEIIVNATDQCQRNLSEVIRVVINGDEKHAIKAKLDPSTGHWFGEQDDGTGLNYDVDSDPASLLTLHHAGGRTGCKQGSDNGRKTDINETVARFEFDCNNIDVTHVELHAAPDKVKIGYVRHAPGEAAACFSWAFTTEGRTRCPMYGRQRRSNCWSPGKGNRYETLTQSG